MVQCNSWHTRAGIERAGEKSYRLEEGEEAGDGGAEPLSATGDRGQTAISFMPDVDCTGSGSLLDSILSTFLKKLSSDVWVAAFFFSHHGWHGGAEWHSERLLQPSCAVLCLGPGPQKLTVPLRIKKTPLPFTCTMDLWFFSYFFFFLSLLIHPLGLQSHRHCSVLLSSMSDVITALTLASRHPGLEIKILYYCLIYSVVQ